MKAPPECSEAQYDTSRANQDPGGPWPEAQQMQQHSRTNFTLTSYVTADKTLPEPQLPHLQDEEQPHFQGASCSSLFGKLSSERPLRLLSPLLPAVCSFLPPKQLTPPAQPSPAPSGPLSSCSHGLEPRIRACRTAFTTRRSLLGCYGGSPCPACPQLCTLLRAGWALLFPHALA